MTHLSTRAALTAASLLLVRTACAEVSPHPRWENSLKPPGPPGPELTLATDGQTDWAILLPAGPTTQEQKAADELARWLGEMTGAEFAIAREGEGSGSPAGWISVGRTQVLADASPAGSGDDLGEERYGIAVDEGRIFLFGGSRRGPLNAVFALLEEDLGCRWYTADTATIPKIPNLRFRPVPRTYTPRLGIRDPFYRDAFDAEWSLRNRTNADSANVPEEWGGSINYPRGWFVHTFESLVPSEVYFEDHPEYYCEIDGERKPLVPFSFGGQLCLTNPDIVAIAAAKVREVLAANPNSELISVSQNDGRGGHCQCAKCLAIDDAEGTRAGTLLMFVNAVAEAIAPDFPDVKVCTLAYQATFMPPKTIRPRENVVIRLCTDTHAWGNPFLFVTETEEFQTALKGWADIGADILIWDYVTNFGGYPAPWPNMPIVSDNIRLYLDHNVTGIMLQGAYQSPGGARAPMRSWVWAKQLWDPSRDTKALMRDFTYGYYGAAAEPMQQYNGLLWQTWERHHDGPTEGKGYPIDRAFVSAARDLFEQAEALTQEDEKLAARVALAKLSVLYADLTLGPEDADAVNGYLESVSEFETIAAAHDVTHVRERPRGVEQHVQRWRAMAGRVLVKPDVPGTVFAEDMDCRLTTHLGEHDPKIEADEGAENGYAVRQPGGNTQWSIQWPIPVEDLKPDTEYLVRLRVRLEKTGDEGAAFHGGVYNPQGQSYPVPTRAFTAADVSGSAYQWCELGQVVPQVGDLVYIAPDDNLGNVQGVYTDRIELVPRGG